MPKMKTNRAAAKRFRALGSGKFKRGHQGKSHILSNKNRKRKRRLTKVGHIHKADQKSVDRLCPYASKLL